MSDTEDTDIDETPAEGTEQQSEPEGQEDLADEWAAALSEQADDDSSTLSQEDIDAMTALGDGDGGGGVAVTEQAYEQVHYQELVDDAGGGGDEDVNMDVIMDIPVTISMEIGRTRINIRNLLQLNQGSVVELDRLAGEPMDVLVNGTLIAHGEVVVVNEKFGIRLTDVISPAERVKKLQ